MAPPSSGGSTVGEALNILEGYRPRPEPRDLAIHHYLEASRYSFADRGEYVGDPGFVDVPLEGLLSDAFAAERARADRAAPRPRARSPAGDAARRHGGVPPTPARRPRASARRRT